MVQETLLTQHPTLPRLTRGSPWPCADARWACSSPCPSLTVPLWRRLGVRRSRPRRPGRLPAALDVYVPYQAQTICDPVPRPGVVAFARLMTSHYGMGSLGLMGRTCGSGPSEHYDGRAWDWMLNVDNPSQEAVAQSVLAWLTAPDKNGVKGAMARRFGIMYIIHDRKMWRSYAPGARAGPPTTARHPTPTTSTSASTTTAPPVARRGGRASPTHSYLTSLPPAGDDPADGHAPTTPPVPAATRPSPRPGRSGYGMTSTAVRHAAGRARRPADTGYFG